MEKYKKVILFVSLLTVGTLGIFACLKTKNRVSKKEQDYFSYFTDPLNYSLEKMSKEI